MHKPPGGGGLFCVFGVREKPFTAPGGVNSVYKNKNFPEKKHEDLLIKFLGVLGPQKKFLCTGQKNQQKFINNTPH